MGSLDLTQFYLYYPTRTHKNPGNPAEDQKTAVNPKMRNYVAFSLNLRQ